MIDRVIHVFMCDGPNRCFVDAFESGPLEYAIQFPSPIAFFFFEPFYIFFRIATVLLCFEHEFADFDTPAWVEFTSEGILLASESHGLDDQLPGECVYFFFEPLVAVERGCHDQVE